MSEAIVVGGRECHFHDFGGHYRITDAPKIGSGGEFLRGDATWGLLQSGADPKQWPTEAEAVAFALSHRDQPQADQGQGGEPITDEWFRSIGALPDGDAYPTELAIRVWSLGDTESYGSEPAMQVVWSTRDGSCWLEAYDHSGDTLCLVELRKRNTRAEMLSLLAELGINPRARCPDCNGTGGFMPAYVSFGEIVGPDACGKCHGTGELPAPPTDQKEVG